ncbi:hypothetical protein BASA60_009644 [Batrachochytrium salamandrivorans]|nr:hypothetical protein BASA60_009644 [Batrachochytrium salamandrivorans]
MGRAAESPCHSLCGLFVLQIPQTHPTYSTAMAHYRVNEEEIHDEIHEALHRDARVDYTKPIFRNASVAVLYEQALVNEVGTAITSAGALATNSGSKKGRSPKDKRIVEESSTASDIWWGPINFKMVENSFMYRIKVRVVCARAYHALFMNNMLIRPTAAELVDFGEPDFTIFNAGSFPANRFTTGMTSDTSISINFARREMVILGTEYAGEMKKGVFTVMHYLMPKRGVLSLHSSANEGPNGDVSLFFGLSGTGKTTLSADPSRSLIGDDEHCWSDHGVFNIEGGCYAKCIDLSAEKEPEIFGAIRFGSVVENVVYEQATRTVDYADASLTENTRLSKLTPEQAMYHFISGYTAKIAGTEEGITEPQATFSSCFGAPFLVWHPVKYATMLAEKIKTHKTNVWLINTGWNGGAYGVGKRISLKYSRAIIDAIHNGELAKAECEVYPIFGLSIPKSVTGCPAEILNPSKTWLGTGASYKATLEKLAKLFIGNFKTYEDQASQAIIAAGPQL